MACFHERFVGRICQLYFDADFAHLVRTEGKAGRYRNKSAIPLHLWPQCSANGVVLKLILFVSPHFWRIRICFRPEVAEADQWLGLADVFKGDAGLSPLF